VPSHQEIPRPPTRESMDRPGSQVGVL
jgi:hypothetical protein